MTATGSPITLSSKNLFLRLKVLLDAAELRPKRAVWLGAKKLTTCSGASCHDLFQDQQVDLLFYAAETVEPPLPPWEANAPTKDQNGHSRPGSAWSSDTLSEA